MPLIDRLRQHLDDADASSHQLVGEDAWLLTGADIARAGTDYKTRLYHMVPVQQHQRFEEEQRALAEACHDWQQRYNKSLNRRIQGYLALGRLCHFQYPWPIVAILGICQVRGGLTRMQLYGLAGRLATRLGLPRLERTADTLVDVLRRTNRGIFSDSVPTVLLALRIHDARVQGDFELAEALLEGPLLPWLDEESRVLVRDITDGLAISDGQERFRKLAATTLRHFDREQSIFTAQMGGHRTRKPQPSRNSANHPEKVRAPRIEGGQVRFANVALPDGFDMRDHHARVEQFGKAFVTSVTGSVEDYRIATAYVSTRFGRGDDLDVAYENGGAPPTRPERWRPWVR